MSERTVVSLLFLHVIALLIALFVVADQRDELKKEAVKRNYAEWVVDQSGKTEWRWKEATDE